MNDSWTDYMSDRVTVKLKTGDKLRDLDVIHVDDRALVVEKQVEGVRMRTIIMVSTIAAIIPKTPGPMGNVTK